MSFEPCLIHRGIANQVYQCCGKGQQVATVPTLDSRDKTWYNSLTQNL